MSVIRTLNWGAFLIAPLWLGACSSLLPKGEVVTEGPWKNFQEAQQTFDKITPNKTTIEALKPLGLSLDSNPNVTLLNYSDVLRRFIPGSSVGTLDLDPGILECLSAKTACKGYEINQKVIVRHRYGNFWADFLNFKRKVDIVGWSFRGTLLTKDDLIIYKLTGGQPVIHERDENENPLGPLQGLGESRFLNNF